MSHICPCIRIFFENVFEYVKRQIFHLVFSFLSYYTAFLQWMSTKKINKGVNLNGKNN
uniref:Uncharacterized protein n=1 Tax=Myoviridae sp. ctY1522 TaxID=2825124 RepID=A0A8S5TR03_9CAUD|nr:MAG TPA: hypothetical protein [Myoviridae sp. ctY1522]